MTFLHLSGVGWTAIQAICTAAGLIVIFIFAMQLKNSDETTRLQLYAGLNEDYLEFMKLCAKNPNLGEKVIHPSHLKFYSDKYGIKREKAIKELVHIELMFCLWERAYLAWKRKWMKKDEWIGWHEWMGEYLLRSDDEDKEGFRSITTWLIAGRTFEENFSKYVANNFVKQQMISWRDDSKWMNLPGEPWPYGLDLKSLLLASSVKKEPEKIRRSHSLLRTI